MIGSAVVLQVVLTPRPTHHTISVTTRLVQLTEDPIDPIWVLATLRREIWIHADGAGRIEETYEPFEFPTHGELQQANALAEPLPPMEGLNETFQRGGLVYVSASELLSRIDQLGRSEIDAGRLLDFFNSYLTETVPSAEATNAAIELAAATEGVEVESRGQTRTVSVLLGTRRTTFTFDSPTSRLMTRQQFELAPRAGLDLVPPVDWVDQTFLLSEDLAP